MLNKLSLITLSIFCLISFTHAQNPLLTLLDNSNGSEERLLYKKPAGPYEITVDGERLLERTYFNLDIRQNNQPLSSDALVRLSINPPESAGSKASTHLARFENDLFIVDDIKLEASQDWGDDNWFITIDVNEASTSFGTLVYQPKPEQNQLFSALNVALPLIILFALLSIYSLKGIKLEHTFGTT